MIKYLELTAPEKNEFRQAKILSIEVAEGDVVKVGDPLFIVQSGKSEIPLPSTMAGKIIEVIAVNNANISVLSPLVLLETEVESSTATLTIDKDSDKPTAKTKTDTKQDKKPKQQNTQKKSNNETKKASKKNQQQQNLDLTPTNSEVKDSDSDTNRTPTTPDSSEKTTMSKLQITVPDIGADSAKVIEILVNVGDQVAIDDPLVTLESDKASMDIPSTHSGTVTSIAVAVDQDVAEGALVVELSSDTDQQADSNESEPQQESKQTQAATAEPSAQLVDVLIPDIGGDSAKVIEILVEVGQEVNPEDPLVTLESDKASMDVPSTASGIVDSIEVSVDQDVSEGVLVLKIKTNATTEAPSSSAATTSSTATEPVASSSVSDVSVPDIGGDAAKVIEILVSVGQQVQKEDSLVTLESDKASMDVPSTLEGTIESIEVKLDQEVSEGTVLVRVSSSSQTSATASPAADSPKDSKPAQQAAAPKSAPAAAQATATATGKSHASPSIRRFARELGVDLSNVAGSGRKGRIVKSDVKAFVKNIMQTGSASQGAASGGAGIPPIPAIDFSKFGDIDIQPLNRIKKLTATNLHRSWLNVPHVTHNDESDISDLESFRKELNKEFAANKKAIKLSPLAFIVKAAVSALRAYPQFNSSLEPGGENIIYKKYFHIGIAVETPNGLVVPVIRDADKKSISEIALAMAELAGKARDKKLAPADMSGASFTISSLGGIGGTSFTPIVNAPEVAILGVARSKMQPIWDGKEFMPRMILPLSLSYDHRIIDGAEAARFTAHIAAALEDVRRLTI